MFLGQQISMIFEGSCDT